MKLNLACGDNVIEGFVNVDMVRRDGVDLVHDIRQRLPYADNSAEQVVLYHAIEHIERRYHEPLLREIHRILQPAGRLSVSFPEFEVCFRYWKHNYKGMREFWESTMFGRQSGPGDYHVVPMNALDFRITLVHCGFDLVGLHPEPQEDYNTIVYAQKGHLYTYTDALATNVAVDFDQLQQCT